MEKRRGRRVAVRAVPQRHEDLRVYRVSGVFSPVTVYIESVVFLGL